MPIDPADVRLILHQIGNLVQPISYQIEKLSALQTDDPVFNQAMSAVPARLAALNRIVERLRILSKPAELNRERTNLSALLKSVWHEVSGQPQYKAVVVKFDLPKDACYIHADEYWLHLALRELLTNAAEAAAASSAKTVTLRIRPSENCGAAGPATQKNWRIEIADSGPGIPKDACCALFATTKSETGAGLGLPIAQHIIAAHGGQLLFDRDVAVVL